MKIRSLAIVVVLLAAAGLAPAADVKPAPTSAPADNLLAMVNGQPIYMDDLNEILLYSYGMPIAQQLVANELVRQEAARKNVAVSDAEIKAENDRTLQLMFVDIPDADQREKTLDQFLVRKSVTRKQWDLTMRRNALLAKLVQDSVTISDDDLRQAYGERYGRRVIVRHIQIPSIAEAQIVLEKLAAGADFAELAKQKSISPTRFEGGLLPVISNTTTNIAPSIKEAALALTKVGQVSPTVQAGTAFHILKLEKVLDNENAKFEDVKATLLPQVKSQKLQAAQQQLLLNLIQKAQENQQIQYINPTLKRLAQEAAKAGEAAQ